MPSEACASRTPSSWAGAGEGSCRPVGERGLRGRLGPTRFSARTGSSPRHSPAVPSRMSRTSPGVIGATSGSSSHRLPSVKSASGRAVSASANDHRLLTQTCNASPYRGMLRVGAWCSNWGTPAGRTNLLLRFGLGQPVLPCTRSTPGDPPWQGLHCVGSRSRLPTSFALFGALMAGTRLRGDRTCRRVVPGWVGEEGGVIGGLRRAGALRRAGFRGHWESVAVSCDRDTDPSHIGCVIRQAPTRIRPSHAVMTDRGSAHQAATLSASPPPR